MKLPYDEAFKKHAPNAFDHLVYVSGGYDAAAALIGVESYQVRNWGKTTKKENLLCYWSEMTDLDEICRKIDGRTESALERYREIFGDSAFDLARKDGLDARVLVKKEELERAMKALRKGLRKRDRLWAVIPWPERWVALDRLARANVGVGWLELVVTWPEEDSVPRAEMGALSEMCRVAIKKAKRK